MPGVLPGGEDGRCVRLTTLPPSCAVVTKSGSLNFLEPCGPVQACNGTDLPLPLFTSKSVGTGPSSYEKRIYPAAVSQGLRNNGVVAADLLHRDRQTRQGRQFFFTTLCRCLGKKQYHSLHATLYTMQTFPLPCNLATNLGQPDRKQRFYSIHRNK